MTLTVAGVVLAELELHTQMLLPTEKLQDGPEFVHENSMDIAPSPQRPPAPTITARQIADVSSVLVYATALYGIWSVWTVN